MNRLTSILLSVFRRGLSVSYVSAQYAEFANRLATHLRKYVQEIRAEAEGLVDSGIRATTRELSTNDATNGRRIRDALQTEGRATPSNTAASEQCTHPETSTPRSPKEKRSIFPDRRKVVEIVRSACARSGNFGIGRADRAEAEAAGLAWVGLGARRLPYGDTYRLVSKDGLRQFRPPQQKPSGRGVEANYEQRSETSRHWEANAHLIIEERR